MAIKESGILNTIIHCLMKMKAQSIHFVNKIRKDRTLLIPKEIILPEVAQNTNNMRIKIIK